MQVLIPDQVFEYMFVVSPDLLCLLDSSGHLLKINPAWTEILGYQQDELVEIYYLDLVHPDDRNEAGQSVSMILESEKPISLTHRIRCKNESFKSIEWHIQKGSSQLVFLSGRDITDKLALESQHGELDIFFSITPDLLSIAQPDGKFLKANQAWKDVLGYEISEIEGVYASQFVHPDEVRQLEQTIKEIKEESNHPEFHQYISRYRHKDNTYRFLEWNTRLYQGKYYCIARDISDRIRRERQIEHISYHDPLTGLYNRRFCEEEIIRIDTDRNLPISVIVGDMNQLKLVNDAFGHDQGDLYIQATAELIRSGCRPDELIARWGGDEFVILLPKTRQADARKIVDRMLKSCKERQISGVQVSIAFGAATKRQPSEKFSDIMKQAEKEMYRTKAKSDRTRKEIIDSFANMLFKRSALEERHARHVRALCEQTALALGFDLETVEWIAMAGLLHDIGKVAINPKILNKPDHLTEEEWLEIRKHSMIGYDVVGTSQDWAEVGQAILNHHERVDGSGYPQGVPWQEIPVSARIIAIADSYDAMTMENGYRQKMSMDQAVEEIRKYKGKQFDPQIAEVFIQQVLRRPPAPNAANGS